MNGRNVLSAIAVALLALAGVIALSGCNTTEGLGQDIQEGGEALEDAAD